MLTEGVKTKFNYFKHEIDEWENFGMSQSISYVQIAAHKKNICWLFFFWVNGHFGAEGVSTGYK